MLRQYYEAIYCLQVMSHYLVKTNFVHLKMLERSLWLEVETFQLEVTTMILQKHAMSVMCEILRLTYRKDQKFDAG